MKIALLIAGYLRGLKENIESIKNNIIQENKCDIYLHITENEKDDRYNNKSITLEYIKTQLNPKLLLLSKNLVFSEDVNVNNLLNRNYKFFWLNEERKKISDIENIRYDIIIIARPDLYLNTKLEYNIDSEDIHIPIDCKIDKKKLIKEDDKFICDIMAYGNVESMNHYLNFYLQIKDLVIKYGNINETILYHYLNNNEIKYVLEDIDYFVILSLCNTIAITGDSGSGKTTISNILKELFINSFLLECDRYHKWERGNENWQKFTHLNPDANYITKMTEDVFDLKIGNNIFQIDYDHKTGKFTDKEIIESKENIIVCGLHSLYIPNSILNLKIYMDTDENLRTYWKIKRDTIKRGYSIEKILSQIESRKDDFEKYIYPQKKNSDVIINFYTNKLFDVHNFQLDEEYDVFLRIGVKECFQMNNIIAYMNFTKISKEDSFIFLYVNRMNDYTDFIRNIIVNLFQI